MSKMKQLFFLGFVFSSWAVSYTLDSSWISVSNAVLKIAVDKKTGRYIVYDLVNSAYPPKTLNSIIFPSHYLTKSSPVNLEDKNYSSILGSVPEILNYTTFCIDGDIVVFGSSSGIWISPPFVQDGVICAVWRLGTLDIMQNISLTKSLDTNEDAILISYDVKNNSSDKSRSIATRIVLDPKSNDGQSPMFYLPDRKVVSNEYEGSRSNIPSYWLSSDENGDITQFSLKGLLRSSGILTPYKVYLTSMEKVLLDPWEYRYDRKRILNNQHSAVVLLFDQKKLKTQTIETVASTMVAIPNSQDQYVDKGLEVSASAFIRKNTTPINVDIWIKAVENNFYDEVELYLSVPYNLEIFDYATKKLTDLGPSKSASPISWSLGVKEYNESNEVNILVKGFKNGVCTTELQIPIEIVIDPNYARFNQEALDQVVDASLSSVDTYVLNKDQISISRLEQEDYLGHNLESLSELYRYLQSIDVFNNKDLIHIIETEQDLIREIQDSERTLHRINQEYQMLIEVYERLYGKMISEANGTFHQNNVQIADMADSLEDSEQKLKKQEKIFADLNKINVPVNF